MFATGMYLPGLLFRATFATAVFVVLFDFISDWISSGAVSIQPGPVTNRILSVRFFRVLY